MYKKTIDVYELFQCRLFHLMMVIHLLMVGGTLEINASQNIVNRARIQVVKRNITVLASTLGIVLE